MFLALRELKHAKLRYLLIGFIMVLISLLVLFVSGLARGLASDNASSVQNMNADYLALQEESDNRLNRSVLTEGDLAEVHQYLNEEAATPLGIQMATLTIEDSPQKLDAAFFAVDAEGMLAPKTVEGERLSNETAAGIIADRSLKAAGLELGDRIIDQASGKSFKVAGFTEGQSFSHAPVIYMNFTDWSSLQTLTAVKDVSFNAIALKAGGETAGEIEKNVSGLEVISKKDALKGIPGYSEEQGSLFMMIAFLFVIAAFVLAVFFYVITIQKMNQFGVLKAIGARSGYLATNIIVQVLTLAIVSLAISIALAFGISYLLPASMPFELTLDLVAGCSSLFLAVSVIGSLLSLYRVVKIDAIEAIGRAA